MGQNCRIGKSLKLVEILWMPTVDLFAAYFRDSKGVITHCKLGKAEAEEIIKNNGFQYEPAHPYDWGSYKKITT